jgi:hypothetical protein
MLRVENDLASPALDQLVRLHEGGRRHSRDRGLSKI